MAEDQLKFPSEVQSDLVNVSTEVSDGPKNSESAAVSHADLVNVSTEVSDDHKNSDSASVSHADPVNVSTEASDDPKNSDSASASHADPVNVSSEASGDPKNSVFASASRSDIVNVSTKASDDPKNSDSASASHAAECTSTSERTESTAEVHLPLSGSSNESGTDKDSSSAAKHSPAAKTFVNMSCPTCAKNPSSDKSGLFITLNNGDMLGKLCNFADSLMDTAASLSQTDRLTQEEFAKTFSNWCEHMYSEYLQALEYSSQMHDTPGNQQSNSQRQGDSNVKSPCTNKCISTTEKTESPAEHDNLPVFSNQSDNEDSSSTVTIDAKILCETCALNASSNNDSVKPDTDPNVLSELYHSAGNDVINSAQLCSTFPMDRKPEGSLLEFLPVTLKFSRLDRLTPDDFAKKFPNSCDHLYSKYLQVMDVRERFHKEQLTYETFEGLSSFPNLPSSSASLSKPEAISPREFLSSHSMEKEVTLQHAELPERNPVSQHSENVRQDEVSSKEDETPTEVLEVGKSKMSRLRNFCRDMFDKGGVATIGMACCLLFAHGRIPEFMGPVSYGLTTIGIYGCLRYITRESVSGDSCGLKTSKPVPENEQGRSVHESTWITTRNDHPREIFKLDCVDVEKRMAFITQRRIAAFKEMQSVGGRQDLASMHQQGDLPHTSKATNRNRNVDKYSKAILQGLDAILKPGSGNKAKFNEYTWKLLAERTDELRKELEELEDQTGSHMNGGGATNEGIAERPVKRLKMKLRERQLEKDVAQPGTSECEEINQSKKNVECQRSVEKVNANLVQGDMENKLVEMPAEMAAKLAEIRQKTPVGSQKISQMYKSGMDKALSKKLSGDAQKQS